ncbi:MAG: hypothetical protein V4616_05170 [Bacteroidota bacterium]
MKTLLLIFTLLSALICSAQDTIVRINGVRVAGRVTEVSPEDVKLIKFADGPVYTIPREYVDYIVYGNGTTEQIGAALSDYERGRRDAKLYYKGYKPAATVTMVTGIISPVVGLAPAVVTSFSPPKDRTFSIPDQGMRRSAEYMRGYRTRAERMKLGKVWTNLAIGTGINAAILFFLITNLLSLH